MAFYVTDYLALILLLMVYFSSSSIARSSGKASRLFTRAVFFNVAFSVSNILDGCFIHYGENLPVCVGYVINMAYFVFAFLMVFFYSHYALTKITEYADSTHLVQHLQRVQIAVLAVCVTFWLTNFWTKLIFYYDAEDRYCHGPLWIICYLEAAVMLMILLVSTVCSKSRGAYTWKKLVIFATLYISLIIGFRFVFPQILLEGIAGTFVALYLFQNYQSSSLDKDPLTRLGNVNAFIGTVEKLLHDKKAFQVIMLTTRNFSVINSNYGYEQGNKLLREIAMWLEEYFPRDCKLFRYSPVAFTVVLPLEDRQPCEERTHRLMEAFPRMWQLNRRNVTLAPIFVDLTCLGDHTPMQVMEELYFARKTLKNSELDHMHFDEMLYSRLQRKKMIIRYLDVAIRDGYFEVWFQPILCVSNNCFCSAEALIRLRDIDGKFISPEEFIPIAEETGQIDQISDVVIESVCRFLKENSNLPIKNISINLSLPQLQLTNFADYVHQKCEKYDLSPALLGFEITERMLATEDNNVQKTLTALHEAGHMLLLDDFGTGYSNFAVIMKYSLDKIKLDKTLLRQNTDKDGAVLKMLIDLFHRNGQTVVVEGVETEVQSQFLKDYQADFLQGFFYSRPLPEEQYREFMLSQAQKEPAVCSIAEDGTTS